MSRSDEVFFFGIGVFVLVLIIMAGLIALGEKILDKYYEPYVKNTDDFGTIPWGGTPEWGYRRKK